LDGNENFNNINLSGCFWSATLNGENEEWCFGYNKEYASAELVSEGKGYSFSVRLFKD
jgi:hypothetical protein